MSADVEKDDSDNYTVDIPIDADFSFEDSTNRLYVDNDIFSTAPDGNIFKLPAGEYDFSSEIGANGGYHLALELQ